MDTHTTNQDSMATRRSLLTRLKDWGDRAGWREFFDTYWQLIYSVAKRSGMREEDAHELVQDVMVSVANQMPDFRYDRAKGSFRGFLMRIVHRRIADFWRRGVAARKMTVAIEDQVDFAEPVTEDFERQWDSEWKSRMLEVALRRVRGKVKLRHYMVFEMAVLRDAPVAEIKRTLGVGLALIYVVKHRIQRLVAAELRKMEQSP